MWSVRLGCGEGTLSDGQEARRKGWCPWKTAILVTSAMLSERTALSSPAFLSSEHLQLRARDRLASSSCAWWRETLRLGGWGPRSPCSEHHHVAPTAPSLLTLPAGPTAPPPPPPSPGSWTESATSDGHSEALECGKRLHSTKWRSGNSFHLHCDLCPSNIFCLQGHEAGYFINP